MDIFDEIDDLETVDPAVLIEYRREMEERVIPEIIAITRARQRWAAEQRAAGIPLY